MVSTTINIGKAANINLINAYTGHSWEAIFDQYENDDETPKNWTGNYTFIICRDYKMKDVIVTIVPLIEENRLTIRQAKTENKFQAGIYYVSLIDDIDSDNSFPFSRGVLKVAPGR